MPGRQGIPSDPVDSQQSKNHPSSIGRAVVCIEVEAPLAVAGIVVRMHVERQRHNVNPSTTMPYLATPQLSFSAYNLLGTAVELYSHELKTSSLLFHLNFFMNSIEFRKDNSFDVRNLFGIVQTIPKMGIVNKLGT